MDSICCKLVFHSDTEEDSITMKFRRMELKY